MAKRKSRPVPRIEVTRNKKKEFNYRIIGKNSQVLISCNQGFKRLNGLLRNLQSVCSIFNLKEGSVMHEKIEGLPYTRRLIIAYRLPTRKYEFHYLPIYFV